MLRFNEAQARLLLSDFRRSVRQHQNLQGDFGSAETAAAAACLIRDAASVCSPRASERAMFVEEVIMVLREQP